MFSAGAAGRGDTCLLYTSDAADERSSVDLGGRRIITKKNYNDTLGVLAITREQMLHVSTDDHD